MKFEENKTETQPAQIIADNDAPSGVLVTTDTASVEHSDMALSSSALDPVSEPNSALVPISSAGAGIKTDDLLLADLISNEHQIFWYFVAGALMLLALWFHHVHGYFFVNSAFSALSLASPLLFFFIQLRPKHKLDNPILALAAFVSMLFWLKVPALTFLLLMIFRFRGGREAGLVALIALQLCAFANLSALVDWIPPSTEVVSYNGHELGICQTVDLSGKFEYDLVEEIPLVPGLTFNKVHWRLVDWAHAQSAFILPYDATSVVVLINRHSDYHRSVVDLTLTNQPIPTETLRPWRY